MGWGIQGSGDVVPASLFGLARVSHLQPRLSGTPPHVLNLTPHCSPKPCGGAGLCLWGARLQG